MSASGAKQAREPRIQRDRKPKVSLCGDCGKRVSETDLLCRECRQKPQVGPDDGGWATWQPSGMRF